MVAIRGRQSEALSAAATRSAVCWLTSSQVQCFGTKLRSKAPPGDADHDFAIKHIFTYLMSV